MSKLLLGLVALAFSFNVAAYGGHDSHSQAGASSYAQSGDAVVSGSSSSDSNVDAEPAIAPDTGAAVSNITCYAVTGVSLAGGGIVLIGRKLY